MIAFAASQTSADGAALRRPHGPAAATKHPVPRAASSASPACGSAWLSRTPSSNASAIATSRRWLRLMSRAVGPSFGRSRSTSRTASSQLCTTSCATERPNLQASPVASMVSGTHGAVASPRACQNGAGRNTTVPVCALASTCRICQSPPEYRRSWYNGSRLCAIASIRTRSLASTPAASSAASLSSRFVGPRSAATRASIPRTAVSCSRMFVSRGERRRERDGLHEAGALVRIRLGRVLVHTRRWDHVSEDATRAALDQALAHLPQHRVERLVVEHATVHEPITVAEHERTPPGTTRWPARRVRADSWRP